MTVNDPDMPIQAYALLQARRERGEAQAQVKALREELKALREELKALREELKEARTSVRAEAISPENGLDGLPDYGVPREPGLYWRLVGDPWLIRVRQTDDGLTAGHLPIDDYDPTKWGPRIPTDFTGCWDLDRAQQLRRQAEGQAIEARRERDTIGAQWSARAAKAMATLGIGEDFYYGATIEGLGDDLGWCPKCAVWVSTHSTQYESEWGTACDECNADIEGNDIDEVALAALLRLVDGPTDWASVDRNAQVNRLREQLKDVSLDLTISEDRRAEAEARTVLSGTDGADEDTDWAALTLARKIAASRRESPEAALSKIIHDTCAAADLGEKLLALDEQIARLRSMAEEIGIDPSPSGVALALLVELAELAVEEPKSKAARGEVADVLTAALHLALLHDALLGPMLFVQTEKLKARLDHVAAGGTWAEAKAAEA